MVFISYRRSDGKSSAVLLKESLIMHGFDKDDVFLDLHNILAEEFPERCKIAIEKCEFFLLLITANSFIKKSEKDYYYDEINYALDHNKKIVPILFDSKFDESIIPKQFIEKRLHLTSAIRYDAEYSDASIAKLLKAIDKYRKPTIIQKISQAFVIPTLFITIYLIISVVGGVIRYVWDNYWLADEVCIQHASKHIQEYPDGMYRYETKDSLYCYDSAKGNTSVLVNERSSNSSDSFNLTIKRSDAMEAGFWTMAVAMVYETSKTKIHYRGNSKQIAVIAAVTVSVIAGFGFGFVVERILFPVHESRLIRQKLHSPTWYNIVIQQKKEIPKLNSSFTAD